jgi:hypothetical protein
MPLAKVAKIASASVRAIKSAMNALALVLKVDKSRQFPA